MGSILSDSATGDYITRTANLPAVNAVTMAGWVKLGASTAGTDRVVCGIAPFASVNGPRIAKRSDNNWYCEFNWETTNGWSPAPAEDVWVYVAVVSDGTNGITAYWWNSSGTLQDTMTDAGEQTGTAFYMTVAARPQTGVGYIGKYAYWKVWDAALSQSDIEADMFSPTFVRTTNANCGFSDSATDIGPNGRDWTLSGTSFDSDTPPVILAQPDRSAMTRRYQHLLIR